MSYCYSMEFSVVVQIIINSGSNFGVLWIGGARER
jgi:hypothetical protein